MAPSVNATILPGDVVSFLTMQNMMVLGAVAVVYQLLKFAYHAWIHPFYFSSLRHLPTPTVSSLKDLLLVSESTPEVTCRMVEY